MGLGDLGNEESEVWGLEDFGNESEAWGLEDLGNEEEGRCLGFRG